MNKLIEFKAAVLRRLNEPVQIYSVSTPTLMTGQVLVKILYAGICHSQLMEIQGKRGEDRYLPHMLGHEGVGEVIKVGHGVTRFKSGDRVIIGWMKSTGIDAGGCIYQSNIGPINGGPTTTFSEYSVISENRLVLKPSNLNDAVSVLLGCALLTGAGMVLNQLKPTEGSSVLVFGLGGIGLSALLALHNFKTKNIVAIDIEPEKLTLAKELGATNTYLSTKEGISHFRKDFPLGVDFAIESAGLCSTIEQAFDLLSKNGLCIFASHPATGDKISIDPHKMIQGKRLQGTWGGASFPERDIPLIADIIADNKLPIDKLISRYYKLDEINTALDDLNNRKIVRALIDMTVS